MTSTKYNPDLDDGTDDVFADAYALLKYTAIDGSGEHEIVWNARDGAVPDLITLRSDRVAFRDRTYPHVRDPLYRPEIGMRIFTTLTQERAYEIAMRLGDRYWHSGALHAELERTFESLSDLIRVMQDELLAIGAELIEITPVHIAQRVGYERPVHELMADMVTRCGLQVAGAHRPLRTVPWPQAETAVTCVSCLDLLHASQAEDALRREDQVIRESRAAEEASERVNTSRMPRPARRGR